MIRIRDAASAVGLEADSISMCHPDWWTNGSIARLVNTMHSYSEPGRYPTLGSMESTNLDWWLAHTRFSESGRYTVTETGAELESFGNDQHRHAQALLVDIFDHLYRGVGRVALYELFAAGSGKTFGVFDANSREPLQAAKTIRRLLRLIGRAHVATPVGFTYTVSDPRSTAVSLAMRDPGGSQYIALWNKRSTAARNVTLRLSAPSAMRVFRPVTSASPTTAQRNAAHSISLGNDPVVVRMDP
jgi:hypothetical protein